MYKHGLSYTPQYRAWTRIKYRCTDPNNSDYPRYGGVGTKLWDGWMNNPVAFCNYIMALPNARKRGYSLDRIETYGHYEPDNLRWADRTIQSRNRRVQINNKSGYAGVYVAYNKYRAQIKVSGKQSLIVFIIYDIYRCSNEMFFLNIWNTYQSILIVILPTFWQNSGKKKAATARDQYIIDNQLLGYPLQILNDK